MRGGPAISTAESALLLSDDDRDLEPLLIFAKC
jgi:hypothetical protein